MDIRPTGNIASSNHPAVEAPFLATGTPKAAVAPVVPAAIVQQPDAAPAMNQLDEALKGLNEAMQSKTQNLEFSVDEDSDRTIVKVVDRQTQEVLLQIPSKEALEIAKALDRAQGLLIQQQA
jgi:flagellar protein FlaG